jgi:hypothetical protein
MQLRDTMYNPLQNISLPVIPSHLPPHRIRKEPSHPGRYRYRWNYSNFFLLGIKQNNFYRGVVRKVVELSSGKRTQRKVRQEWWDWDDKSFARLQGLVGRVGWVWETKAHRWCVGRGTQGRSVSLPSKPSWPEANEAITRQVRSTKCCVLKHEGYWSILAQ